MIKKFFLALLAIIIVFLVVVALQPAEFHVERSTAIAAPAKTVFAHVNDFHQWQAWSPWEKLDPAMKKSFDGPPAGVGAVYNWSGNDQVGEGRMTLIESRANELVKIKLQFVKPFEATNTTEFAFKPANEQTQVTWSMSGTNNFIGKAFGLIMDMDKTVGGDFEKGLAALKTLAESGTNKKQ